MDNSNYSEQVREVQGWLRELHYAGYPIELIIPDGIYDSRTRTAVLQFQRIVGLDATGVVNTETWDALYEQYRVAVFERSRPMPLYAFPEELGYTVRIGEVSDIVMITQIILLSLAAYYDDIAASLTGEYDAATSASVKVFQGRAGLDATGELDKETWNALADMYASVNRTRT